MSEITCSFCRGTGKDPFGVLSWLSTCCVCSGRRVVDVPSPYKVCPHCAGTGAVKTLTCTTCMGKGYIPLPSRPIVRCPECHGSGDSSSIPSLACIKCHGKGFITES
ncbi:MAG: hypothetical protein M0T73_14850 [Deltaproteobacteria bacterium]|nr:hypothetical protein [Deltaproteobacteria bacterium]